MIVFNFASRLVSEYIQLDGYVLPRVSVLSSNIGIPLLEELYKKHGTEFIGLIKGNFIIQLTDADKNTHIFTDHIGIKKVFYWQNGTDFIISDSINTIVEKVKPALSATNLALHSLFHHFVDGRTMYEDVYYSKPASHFIITADGQLKLDQYWNYSKLLELPKQEIGFEQFSDLLNSITKSYLSLSNSKHVTMTLTGGMDSRIVLGALLANGTRPFTFTFGNENSADVKCAKEIAEDLNIEYNNYNFPEPNADWYTGLSNEIVDTGNSLVHIHRSHRLDAMKREKAMHPDVNTIFLGAMGGEGIRGLHYDDLITTSFLRRYYENKEPLMDLIHEYCGTYFHKPEVLDFGKIYQIISNLPYIKNDYKTNQFYLLYELVASLHDTQDITLYYQYYSNVVCPFLDIDYLELLFSSQYHLLNKNATSQKIKDRLSIPEFHVNVSHLVCKSLSSFQYSNGFSPREYLLGKYPYLFLRGIRKYFKKKYPANFSYDEWFGEFVSENFENINSELGKIFEINEMKETLKGDHGAVEGYWHKYSNIIMYDMILSYKLMKL